MHLVYNKKQCLTKVKKISVALQASGIFITPGKDRYRKAGPGCDKSFFVKHRRQTQEGGDHLEVRVRENDVERALKSLKLGLQKEGLFRELKKRKYYAKPSVKKKLKQIEALKKRQKALRFKTQKPVKR